jgi:thiamine-monophosphate kinase
MGARPTALVVAVAAPPETEALFLESLADGLRDACAELAPGCGVVGGDLSVSATLVIAVTAFGDLEGRDAVLRSGARPGDVVAVSVGAGGALGLAAEGLALLFEQGVDDEGVPDAGRALALRNVSSASIEAQPIEAQLTPRPPLADGIAAARAGATAMLDLSDGLAIDARRIADASGVALDLDSTAVGSPLALAGGEDHALLATFPAGTALPGGFRRIGAVREGSGLLVDGRAYGERGGWDPYADWDGAAG